MTRRGLLSVLSLAYSPHGIAGPFLLEGRSIIQELCKNDLKWDEKIPQVITFLWNRWMNRLQGLNKFAKISHCSLHLVFSGAIERGYGQDSYLRLVDNRGKIHCTLLTGKSQVAPTRYVSIPKLELTAATISGKASKMLHKELNAELIQGMGNIYWTDS